MAESGSAIPNALRGLLGLQKPPPDAPDAPASWKDRLKPAAYTSPSNKRILFSFENVSRETPLRNTPFEFPGINDAYVQPNGFGARRYPLRCIFWGPNHDLIATAFEAALCEPGRGKLEHPLYGKFDVIPMGDITRRDDLKDGANQTIIEVTFWTSTGAVYPSSIISARSEILAAIEGFDVAAAQQFTAQSDLTRTVPKENLKTRVRNLLNKASNTLSAVAAVNTAVISDFRDAQSAINFGLDVLVGQPLQLAQQMSNMIQAPAIALAAIEDRLEAYAAFAESIFNSPESRGLSDGSTLPRVQLKNRNDFLMDDLSAMSGVGGSVLSAMNNTFTTKPQALVAAESVLSQLNDVVEWREQRFEALGLVDTGESYQAMQHAVALVAGYLIQISATLIPERRVVLDRNRTIVDLCAELYGSIDDKLDFLINTNNLSGDEIVELRRGRVIKFYI